MKRCNGSRISRIQGLDRAREEQEIAPSQPREAFLDLLVGQAVVGQRVGVLRSAGTFLALGVTVDYRLAGLVGELDAEVLIDALDAGHRILDELEVVDVAELRGVMVGPNVVEPPQTSRPRLQRILADLRTDERIRPARRRMLRQ